MAEPLAHKLAEPKAPPSRLPAGRIAFTYPDFTLYQAARFFIVAALEMQSVAVGWQMYGITRRPLDLGLIGLAQFLPGMLLFLVSGHVADRFDRRKVVTLCYCGFAVSSGLLWAIAWLGSHSVRLIYAAVVLVGVVLREGGDGLVEDPTVAQIRGDGHPVPKPDPEADAQLTGDGGGDAKVLLVGGALVLVHEVVAVSVAP